MDVMCHVIIAVMSMIVVVMVMVMVMIVNMAVLVAMPMGMTRMCLARHLDRFAGLDIERRDLGAVSTSAMAAHQAASSNSMVLILSSSPCRRSIWREPQGQGA